MRVMEVEKEELEGIIFNPVTPGYWRHFETLFGQNGADGGCWCMWWRLPEKQFEEQTGEVNKAAMKQLIESGEVPGILAFSNKKPIAWCSVGPRELFPALHRYWELDNALDKKTWSIVCFFVEEKFRHRGLMKALIQRAIDYALSQGAEIIEGYPTEPKNELTGFGGFTGIASVYKSFGFIENGRNSRNEILMRYLL
jgi:GNAT superfamily N-acetyltransferase